MSVSAHDPPTPLALYRFKCNSSPPRPPSSSTATDNKVRAIPTGWYEPRQCPRRVTARHRARISRIWTVPREKRARKVILGRQNPWTNQLAVHSRDNPDGLSTATAALGAFPIAPLSPDVKVLGL